MAGVVGVVLPDAFRRNGGRIMPHRNGRALMIGLVAALAASGLNEPSSTASRPRTEDSRGQRRCRPGRGFMRKLASVVIVKEVEPIAGADAIELARIQGWQCVVKKGEFKPDDRAVYFEIDSIPPDDARFRWLWTSKNGPAPAERPAKFRIRTLRL